MLIFRVPGLTPAGGVSERFVSLQDIYPALAELSGLQAPDYVDGRSIKKLRAALPAAAEMVTPLPRARRTSK